MDGHFILYFATGNTSKEEENIDNESGGYNPIANEPVSTPQDELDRIKYNDILDIIRTIPKDLENNVKDISTIQIHFDQPIVFWGDESTDISINAISLVYGVTSNVPTVVSTSTNSNKLLINTAFIVVPSTTIFTFGGKLLIILFALSKKFKFSYGKYLFL